jgi:hypothetical protein
LTAASAVLSRPTARRAAPAEFKVVARPIPLMHRSRSQSEPFTHSTVGHESPSAECPHDPCALSVKEHTRRRQNPPVEEKVPETGGKTGLTRHTVEFRSSPQRLEEVSPGSTSSRQTRSRAPRRLTFGPSARWSRTVVCPRSTAGSSPHVRAEVVRILGRDRLFLRPHRNCFSQRWRNIKPAVRCWIRRWPMR